MPEFHPGNRIDTTPLLAAWNARGYYRPTVGDLPVHDHNGQSAFHFSAGSPLTIPHGTPGPVSDRVYTHIFTPSHEEDNADATVVLNGGWGEPTAAVEGAMTSVVLDSLLQAGYERPELVGFNAQGMGTHEYIHDGLTHVSRHGLSDDLDDSRAMMEAFLAQLNPDSDVYFVGHSLGAMRQLGQARALWEREDRQGYSQIKGLVGLNGVTGNRMEFLGMTPLRATGPHLLQTAIAIANGHALDLTLEEKARIMFGVQQNPDRVAEYGRRTLPASARTFAELALPRSSGEFEKLIRDFRGRFEHTRLWAIDSFKDTLLPGNNSEVLRARLARHGVDLALAQVPGRHAFPVVDMPRVQALELGNRLRAVFGQGRDRSQ